MLHLRPCYVSKAAILTVPVQVVPTEIEVPLEFQGLGSARRRFVATVFPASLTAIKSALVAAEDPSVSGVSAVMQRLCSNWRAMKKSVDAVKTISTGSTPCWPDSADLEAAGPQPGFFGGFAIEGASCGARQGRDIRHFPRNSSKFSPPIAACSCQRRDPGVRALVARFQGEATADVTVAETLSEKISTPSEPR